MTGREKETDIVLFDGQCVLCSAVVRFVIRRDPRGRFRFASLDSAAGTAIIDQLIRGRGDGDGGKERRPGRSEPAERQPAGAQAASGSERLRKPLPDTFMLVRGGKLYLKSQAALEVVRSLRGLWPLLYALIVVPAAVRDPVYDFVARHRYRWFGRHDSCLLPAPDHKDRFIQ